MYRMRRAGSGFRRNRRAGLRPTFGPKEPVGETQLRKLLAPYPAERMTMWPVDKRVANVKNNDPLLIEPVSLDYLSLQAGSYPGHVASGPSSWLLFDHRQQ